MSISLTGSGATISASGSISLSFNPDTTTIGTTYTASGAISETSGTIFLYNSTSYVDWQGNHSYSLGINVRDVFGQDWQVTTAGTSSNFASPFVNNATMGQTVSDNTVVWTMQSQTFFSMTLAAPTSGTDDGKLLRIMTLDPTPNPHKVVVTGGAGFSSFKYSQSATAKSDQVTLMAYQGVWYKVVADGTPQVTFV